MDSSAEKRKQIIRESHAGIGEFWLILYNINIKF
jgi:hypothetical protein